jgi:WD40 repeat protein
MNELDPTEEVIFNAARQFADAEKLRQYLDLACDGEPEMRQRIERLLDRAPEADSFFGRNAAFAKNLLAPAELGSVQASPGVDEQAGAVIGRYKLLEKIGEGGMGVVYMAEQREPVVRKVALKVIKVGMDTRQVVARFEAERQALALMDHPNIAKVLDGGATDTGRPYFVMELVQGVPITEFCDKSRLSAQERIKLFLPVCQAIQSAHQKGIIHRDLKPANILVTLNPDGSGHPMVIDFGVAKATNQALTEKTLFTRYAAMIGTPAYMSPEQAEMSRLDVDTRADIYGLGVLLYELLTGTTPFPEKRLRSVGYNEMQRIIVEEEPERPSTRVLKTPRGIAPSPLTTRHSPLATDLDWIVMKCLEKDRGRRYETANGLAMDLQRHLNNEPVVARSPSRSYQFQKFVRRHRATATAAAAVGMVLVLGALVSTWEAIRATQARRQAEVNEREAQAAQASEAQQRRRAETQAYVANIRLAQEAWTQGEFPRLRQVLEETASYPGRGFEWYYWQRQAHVELQTFYGHSDVVQSAAFSPNGQRVVTCGADHTARVWDTATGKELFTLKGHDAGVNSVAFSPDGLRIATGSDDRTGKVWDAANGNALFSLKGHTELLSCVAFSPDGRRIITASKDGTAKVWDAAGEKEPLTFTWHTTWLNSVAYASDGQRIVSASDEGTKVWEAASGKELLSLPGRANTAAISPDGQRIVAGLWDGTAKVWDAASGRELFAFKVSSTIWSVAVSPDSRRILTGGPDVTAKLWDAANGKELFSFNGHDGAIRAVAFSADGQRILTGSDDQTAKVWEAPNRKEPLTLKGHSGAINSVAFSPDGQRILTGSDDTTARVWETISGNELVKLTGHGGPIRGVAFSPDGRRIVTGSNDRSARVWEASGGERLFTLTGHKGWISTVAFSPDGRRIVTCSWDHTAKVWDASSGKELLNLKGHTRRLHGVAFSPDGRQIATGSEDHTAKLWDSFGGKELLTLKGHNDSVNRLSFSPDGRRILTGSNDRTARIWETATGRELLTLKGQGSLILGVGFSPDGERIVTGGADNAAKLWEASSGQELLTLNGHTAWARCVAFSPDGQRIVTGSWDQTAKVWQSATAQEVAGWKREEKAADERAALLRQSEAAGAELERARRAREPGAITQWLILAPIPFETRGQPGSGLVALDQEQIPLEARLRPRAGNRVKAAENELVWSALQMEDGVIDLDPIVTQQAEFSVAYAVCYILSEADHGALLMKVGTIGQAKIYLNGKQIYWFASSRANVPEQNVVTGVELRAGVNLLVFKLVNELGPWQGWVRLTDAAGQPVKGTSVTVIPP